MFVFSILYLLLQFKVSGHSGIHMDLVLRLVEEVPKLGHVHVTAQLPLQVEPTVLA